MIGKIVISREMNVIYVMDGIMEYGCVYVLIIAS